jgi:hypothetical protein
MMKLEGGLGHLTYCMNIHPTETWEQVCATLEGSVASVKQAISPNDTFDVGLRLSGAVVKELMNEDKRYELASILVKNDFRALTMNGFPYGPFHGTTVKEQVYQPDWTTRERVEYTKALADIMVDLAHEGETVSLSTVPGTFKPLSHGFENLMASNILETVAYCVMLRATRGITVALALEPEPYCFLETIEETVKFFDAYFFSECGVSQLAAITGLTTSKASDALPRHLGICYDVCHAAVEFEDAAQSIAELRRANIPVHKIQLSAALQVAEVTPEARAALDAYSEPTYLHQVVSRNGLELCREPDLPDALARGEIADGEEWRIHFHVPIFTSKIKGLGTTQAFLIEILKLHMECPISTHLEVETYTWNVLPDELRSVPMDDAIIRELTWVVDQLR